MREGALSRPMAALLRFLTRGPVLREGGDGLVTLQRKARRRILSPRLWLARPCAAVLSMRRGGM